MSNEIDLSACSAGELWKHVAVHLSPTDCVRDRLASYIHFEARECLDQAVLVAKARPIDWSKVEDWCRAEGSRGETAFDELQRLAR